MKGEVVMLFGTVSVGPGSLPGTDQLQQIINGLGTWALMAALVGMLLGAAVWALGHHSANYQQAANGRKGLLVSVVAALIIGAAPALINFFFNLGGQVKPQ
jgi:MFS family permease